MLSTHAQFRPRSIAAVRLLAILVTLALGALASVGARAHDTCCEHTHTGNPNNANVCVANQACFAPWDYGICVDKVTHGYEYCSCQWTQDDYALLLVIAMSSIEGQPPAENTTRSYQTTIGPDSFGELLFNGGTVVSFAPATAGPGGFLQLSFGSFADPTAVPVTLDQWFFEFPPGSIGGSDAGPSSTALAPGPSPQLIYNSLTGVMASPPENPVVLFLTNDIDTDAPLRLLWSSQFAPAAPGVSQAAPAGNGLQIQIQSIPATEPAPAPPVAVPAFPQPWAIIVAVLLAATAATVAWRRRRA